MFGAATPFPTSGSRKDPYLGYNFVVELGGLTVGGFRDVQGLEAHVKTHEYAEGGENGYAHQLPGETRYSNLVLTHGLTDVDTLWTWFDDVTKGIIKRRSVGIILLDLQRQPVLRWDIRDALPVKWTGPQFSAVGGTEVATESIELVHRGIRRSKASQST